MTGWRATGRFDRKHISCAIGCTSTLAWFAHRAYHATRPPRSAAHHARQCAHANRPVPRFEVVRRRGVIKADLHEGVDCERGIPVLPHRAQAGVKGVGLLQELGNLRPRGELDQLDHRHAELRADVLRPISGGE